jgi:hypothetical protein
MLNHERVAIAPEPFLRYAELNPTQFLTAELGKEERISR